jgi:ParB-like chromosome segregation protein Spo0J
MKIADITIGERHRKELGDLAALAASIEEFGLLQPIGVTAEAKLVFGLRRLVACRDHLGRAEIETREINIASITAGGLAENDIRKDFTVSERVAIMKTIAEEIGNRAGRPSGKIPQISAEFPEGSETREIAAKRAGFGNRTTAVEARYVVNHGTPELIAAMDSGKASINGAYQTAHLLADEQRKKVDEASTKKKRLRGVRDTTFAKPKSKAAPSKSSEPKPAGPQIAIIEVAKQIRPLIKRLKIQGKTHGSTFSQAEILAIAWALEVLLAEWSGTRKMTPTQSAYLSAHNRLVEEGDGHEPSLCKNEQRDQDHHS